MPAGMFLRSGPDWHLDASQVHTFEAFLAERGIRAADVDPVPIATFLDYPRWFQHHKHVAVRECLVTGLSRNGNGSFLVALDDGETHVADRRLRGRPGAGGRRPAKRLRMGRPGLARPGWWRTLTLSEQEAITRKFWEVGRLTLEWWLTPRLQGDRFTRRPGTSVIVADGFPVLDQTFQTSLAGLYLPGFTGTRDFGPFFGFTKGCPTAAAIVTRALTQK
jgi:hypothetical protein